MNDEHSIAEKIKRIGKGMEILGVIGAVAGLGFAAASGPMVVGAVLAEISVDMTIGAIGLAASRSGDRIASFLSRFRYTSRMFGGNNDVGVGKMVSRLAMVTAPIEIASGFAIAESTKPMAIAAITFTALPCAVTAIGGLMHDRRNRKRNGTDERGGPIRRMLKALEERATLIDGRPIALKELLRTPEHAKRSKKIY